MTRAAEMERSYRAAIRWVSESKSGRTRREVEDYLLASEETMRLAAQRRVDALLVRGLLAVKADGRLRATEAGKAFLERPGDSGKATKVLPCPACGTLARVSIVDGKTVLLCSRLACPQHGRLLSFQGEALTMNEGRSAPPEGAGVHGPMSTSAPAFHPRSGGAMTDPPTRPAEKKEAPRRDR